MKQNTKINYDMEEGEEEKVELSALELSDFIDDRIEKRGKGRMSKEFKKEINGLIDEYNTRFGKTYHRIA